VRNENMMTTPTVNDPETRSADLVAENTERLKALFPEILTEGPDGVSVNMEVLKALVGDKTVTDADEKYGLTWHGKRRSRQLALTPSTGTLRPCPEDSVDWDTTQNLIIEGDNLEVLKLLQKSYAGKVKLIYIDPPYNTGKDFVYPDDFQDSIKNYLELTGQVEGGVKISSNTEASGRFHTAWLNMMYPRLKLARALLRDDGVLFATIDDGEAPRLRALLDEIFGEENFVTQVEWQKRYTRSNNTDDFTSVIDHICVYQKSDAFAVNLLKRDDVANARFTNPDNDPRGPWKATPFLNQVAPERRPNLCYPIKNPNTGKITHPARKAWRYERAVFEKLLKDERLYWGKDGTRDVPDIKTFLSEVRQGMTPINLWTHEYAGHTDQANREIKELFGEKVFDTPKPIRLIQRMLEHGDDGEGFIMDFFAGVGATGHAVLAQNASDGGSRRYVLVQLPEPLDPADSTQKAAADLCDKLERPRNIAELTKERLRRSSKRIMEESPMFAGDVGFRVFKLDSSNIRAWEPDPENLDKALLDSVEHIRPGRAEADVLYELLLKRGLDLCVPIETRAIAGRDVHAVGGGVLIACLASRIERRDVEELTGGIISWWRTMAPAGDTTCVFRDSAFEDDVAKTNLAAILDQQGITNVRSL
jgi:adenine-specific DNA-methyltransferase